jgi:hypothetical protein
MIKALDKKRTIEPQATVAHVKSMGFSIFPNRTNAAVACGFLIYKEE